MKKFLSFLGKYQLRLQATILWLIALFNFMSESFWFFAIPAIIASGIQDILDEIRQMRKDGQTPELF
jgi:hypothetical protein